MSEEVCTTSFYPMQAYTHTKQSTEGAANLEFAPVGCLMLPSGLAHCSRPKPELLGPAKTEPWPAASSVSCADSLGCKGGSLASKARGPSAARPSGLPFVGLLEGDAVGLVSAFCTLSIGALGCASAMFPKLDSANGFAKTGNADGADADTAVGESCLEAVGW